LFSDKITMKKVIIIDNDRDTLEILRYVFEGNKFIVLDYPYRISTEKIIEEKPDIVLIDYYLEYCYGSEICFSIKNNLQTKHIPVILLSTALFLRQIASECLADAYVEKPFDISALENLVNKLLIQPIQISENESV
jgi:DNA-binding response OmpR family regulator